MVWVYDRTNGNLLVAGMLMHAGYTAFTFILGPPTISGVAFLTLNFAGAAALWVVVAAVAVANGPISAALIVTAVIGGRPALAEFAGRILRWRVGAGWFVVSVFSPFLIFALSAPIVRLLGGPWLDLGLLGLGEESGWRGLTTELVNLCQGRTPPRN